MSFEPPERFNISDYFLDDRIREGKGDRTALICGDRKVSYREVQAQANRMGNALRALGVEPEQRVIIALPDGPEWVAAFFGTLKIGAAVVMLNPFLKPEEIAYFLDYTRAKAVVVHAESAPAFAEAARMKEGRFLKTLLVAGGELSAWPSLEKEAAKGSDRLENFPSHRDDAAIWLFSGGTTGKPKAVVQTHRSFANTTELYAKQTVGYREADVTLSVPKLYFGYATGCNLLFPFAVGAAAVLFPDRSTPEALFREIRAHKPTILVNVPTMISQMVSHPEAARQDLSSIRFSTSAGEALPVELHRRWKEAFGVELLDGLGTAEMWHIFITNRPGDVRPGTLGRAVAGFDVAVRDEAGNDLPPGEVGWLWVRGGSRAIGYWQQMERTQWGFRGEWYVTGDMASRDAGGYFSYHGRGDEMLKVSGKWLAPAEVESCLLAHPAVKECAVVGVVDAAGLTVPKAFVVPKERKPGLEEALKAHAKERLETYKHPRAVVLMDALPRTHLGKVNRALLRRS